MDLAELTEVVEADVLVDDVPVARLHRRRDRVTFEYLADATADVATSLPRSISRVDTHAPGALPAFFAGLLPEGRRLSGLRRAVKTSADDEFSLLLAVGYDTVGNVTVVPAGLSGAVPNLSPIVTTDNWSNAHFWELRAAASGEGEDPDRFGVPGVQDKVSARMITFPVRGEPAVLATHILKLNPPEFPFLVENESFFAGAARDSGLLVAETRLVYDADGVAGLLVTRFDRSVHRRAVRRRAQEDACQVLGRYPADKYLMSAEQIAAALSTVCQAGPVASLALVRQFTFAYVSCNGDAHAKNFSILRHGDEWRVSPAYDLPSSHPYRDTTMAVSLNGKRDQRLGRNDLIDFGRALGLREAPVIGVIDRIADGVDGWINSLDEVPFDDRRIHDLIKAIRYRQRRLRGR